MPRQTEEEKRSEEGQKRLELQDYYTMNPKKRPAHWSKAGGVANLTMEYIAPRPKPEGWACTKCDMERMNLLPVSLDANPEFWICSKCQRTITIEERDEVFEAIRSNIQDAYQLKTFEYNKETNQHIIESNEWIGETRIGATRKKVTNIEQQELIDQLLNSIEDTLSIHVNNIKDYFLES